MYQSNVMFEPVGRRRLELSRHAKRRSQQRGLTRSVVPVITAFGDRSHDGHGGIRYLMTERAMSALVRALGRSQRIDALAGAYVVVSVDDGSVITIGHRHP